MNASINKYRFFLLFSLVTSTPSLAQFDKEDFIEKDPRINILIQKQIELNRNEIMRRTYLVQGYRIQIISSNNRELVLKLKADLLKYFPSEQSYLIYQSPNFRLLFGNYPSYKEAQMSKAKLESHFKKSLLIVPSKIEIKGVQLLEKKK